jgi:hypothetical protein
MGGGEQGVVQMSLHCSPRHLLWWEAAAKLHALCFCDVPWCLVSGGSFPRFIHPPME